MSFANYYRKEIMRYGGAEEYVLAKASEKKALLKRVMKYAKTKRILEAGCGSSSNSIYLSNNGYEVTAADKDYEIILLAKEISKSFNKKPFFLVSRIENIKKQPYSVIFSHGVLEHFSNEGIIRLINKELNLGDYVVFSVPSNFFKPSQSINGDERFMSESEWVSILSKTNGAIIEKFSYFYDLDNAKLKALNFLFKITLGLLPMKKPYIGFVLKKNVCNT